MANVRTVDKEARLIEQLARGRRTRYTYKLPLIVADARTNMTEPNHILASAIDNESNTYGVFAAPCEGKIVRVYANGKSWPVFTNTGATLTKYATVKLSKAVIGVADVDLCSALVISSITPTQQSMDTALTYNAPGTFTLTVTAAGMTGSPETTVDIDAAADSDTTAAAARVVLTANTNISAFFTISGATNHIILTAKTAAANDATMNITRNNGTGDVDLGAITAVAGQPSGFQLTNETALDATLSSTAGYLSLITGQLVYATLATTTTSGCVTRSDSLIINAEFVPTDAPW